MHPKTVIAIDLVKLDKHTNNYCIAPLSHAVVSHLIKQYSYSVSSTCGTKTYIVVRPNHWRSVVGLRPTNQQLRVSTSWSALVFVGANFRINCTIKYSYSKYLYSSRWIYCGRIICFRMIFSKKTKISTIRSNPLYGIYFRGCVNCRSIGKGDQSLHLGIKYNPRQGFIQDF